MESHAFYLELCLQCAWREQLQTLPNPAVAALVLDKGGAILSLEAHKESGKPHAEVLALQKAYAKLSGDSKILALQDSYAIHRYLLQFAIPYFKDSTIYVTLEPCASVKCGKTPSCATLLKALCPKCVVIGAQDPNKSAKGGAQELIDAGISVIKAWEIESLKTIHSKATALLEPFRCLQEKGRVVVFKYASRLDGSIDGGQISTRATQSLMHNYRAKADTLLISGKSVREDNPTLDTRFATLAHRNPNVCILTRQVDFPRTAPLFAIPNRRVDIMDTLPSLQGFIFCEGGAGLLASLQEEIDILLVMLNASFNSNAKLTMRLQREFQFLHSMQSDNDILLWLAPKRS